MKRVRQKPSALLHDLRIAAVRKARQEHSAYIAECVFFGARAEQSAVVPVRDQASGLEYLKRWISARGEGTATDAAVQRVLSEGGLYRPGFKLKLEPTEWYALLYDVKIDVGLHDVEHFRREPTRPDSAGGLNRTGVRKTRTACASFVKQRNIDR